MLNSDPSTDPTTLTEMNPGLNILIIEDDYTARTLLQHMLKNYGTCTVATDGLTGLQEFTSSLNAGKGYDLICLDIMMHNMNGYDALRQIRAVEQDKKVLPSDGVKILMTTAIDSLASVKTSYFELCDGYLTKPLHKDKLIAELKALNLITEA
ncbi:MAG: response regulator [Bacteroidetes bacterium]|nr:response regulator [Bacteroidota bacterium]MCH8524584.1 response regulator [Balneolales bacterium]